MNNNVSEDSPYPVRLGKLKSRLAEDAVKEDRSIHYLILRIIRLHYERVDSEKAAEKNKDQPS